MKGVWPRALYLRFLGLAAVLCPLFFLPPLRSLCGGLAAQVAALALSAASDGSCRGSEGASGSLDLGSLKIPRGMIGVTARGPAGGFMYLAISPRYLSFVAEMRNTPDVW